MISCGLYLHFEGARNGQDFVAVSNAAKFLQHPPTIRRALGEGGVVVGGAILVIEEYV